MYFRFIFLVLIALSFFAGNVRAEEYTKPTWADLTRTLVRFSALKLTDQNIIDEYSIVTECDLYQAFFHDDFKWKSVREAVLLSVRNNVATFPLNYRYDASVQIDRYDFDKKIFLFTKKSIIHNVNTFTLYSVMGTGCGVANVKSLPRAFRAVLPTPVTIDGLPLSETDGRALLKQMDENGNPSRIVYARFNIRITRIEPLIKIANNTGTHFGQAGVSSDSAVTMGARMDSVDFYADEERTHLIYHYEP